LAVGLAFSADGKRLATASHDRTVKIWDPSTGRSMLTLAGFAKETCLAFSADGNRLAASAMDGTIRLWDAKPVATAEGKAPSPSNIIEVRQWRLALMVRSWLPAWDSLRNTEQPLFLSGRLRQVGGSEAARIRCLRLQLGI
jgi:WD40 repeat protein